MWGIIDGVDLTGVMADLRNVCLGALGLGLILCASFMIARILGVNIGGLDDD